jgi:hypothetical protein
VLRLIKQTDTRPGTARSPSSIWNSVERRRQQSEWTSGDKILVARIYTAIRFLRVNPNNRVLQPVLSAISSSIVSHLLAEERYSSH